MCNYVFTNSMKRHERSDLCFKLYKELKDNNRLYAILLPLKKIVEQQKKVQNKFSPGKEPIYAMSSIIYKGASIYVIVHKNSSFDIVFNTSPIDAPYVEFIKIVDGDNMKTNIYTQHALDRYNERMHNASYKNHKDIMKRFLVNNPLKSHFSIERRKKRSVAKLNEGFLWGVCDKAHQCVVVNTFYDSAACRDKKNQRIARKIYEKMSKFSIIQFAMYNALRKQLFDNIITEDEFDGLLIKHKLQID